MASYLTASEAYTQEKMASGTQTTTDQAAWADKYRGATVEDLDPPPALSVSPSDPIASAMLAAYERDYTHLTVISSNRALLGYLSIPRLKEMLKQGTVKETDPVSVAMQRFNRKRGIYKVITMETPLEELEEFFESESGPSGEKREKQQFAVVTDVSRKFVLGVATKADLEEFVKRRPA
ncbi:putative cystathionine beta-synthase (beta-thionase) [Aspergillus clavatus NRRL 1]|uniref:Cystathionine beta-synthase (Beta-thionase), putative n=1 Tax=Aspergillus clavatus (strain ATCC 1007 / CBS 513.65 / DSM 816 / NCTC 3887 / NRRL 1 / QM 1276 / 107) TaxID=344612 RepID=A1CJW2_ASPCL|nr:cystathionine beta-synthase (beta-thionase), putative [Aspergillus clavatus NRRL 1]EAW09436.1 cystathionine beta-synthase (beta-thionase), putative [Aspergillus clavatus NRRL 1]